MPRKTYAASFGKDPQFYDFYRAMQSYQTTFIGDGKNPVAGHEPHFVAKQRLFEGILWTRANEVSWTFKRSNIVQANGA